MKSGRKNFKQYLQLMWGQSFSPIVAIPLSVYRRSMEGKPKSSKFKRFYCIESDTVPVHQSSFMDIIITFEGLFFNA